jgi:hypothetical protein
MNSDADVEHRTGMAHDAGVAGTRCTFLGPLSPLFNPESPRIKEDILRMIVQYLQGEGYSASVLTLQDEANVKTKERLNKMALFKRLRKAILDGEWPEVEKLCTRAAFRSYKSLLYAIYKQQYLELIDKQESQKAFTLLSRRLKPLEGMQRSQAEFRDLCYLLTCKSIQDVPSCRDWEGIVSARAQLVEQFRDIFESESGDGGLAAAAPKEGHAGRVPPDRLVTLLQQAVQRQVGAGQYHPRLPPRVTTLIDDYHCFTLPNAGVCHLAGHTRDVKAVGFVGEEGRLVMTGGSDNTVRLWDPDGGNCVQQLHGHTSRIWAIASDTAGRLVASASGDGLVKLWDVAGIKPGQYGDAAAGAAVPTGTPTGRSVQDLASHEGDVYRCDMG